MTSPSPKQQREAYEEVLRERFGAVAEVAAEAQRPLPPPARYSVPAVPRPSVNGGPARTPAGAGRYAAEHDRILRWIKRSHPDWHPQLCVIGDGGVAHVITGPGATTGYSLCGKRGPIMAASDTIPPCRVCTR